MLANFVRVESRFATFLQSGPCTCAGLQVVTQFTHDFQGLFRSVDVEPPNLRPSDSVENRDSHDNMSLGTDDTVRNLITPIKPSRTSNKKWLLL